MLDDVDSYALQQETQTTKKRISLVLKDNVDDVGPGEGGVGGLGGGLGLFGRGSFQRKLIDIGTCNGPLKMDQQRVSI